MRQMMKQVLKLGAAVPDGGMFRDRRSIQVEPAGVTRRSASRGDEPVMAVVAVI